MELTKVRYLSYAHLKIKSTDKLMDQKWNWRWLRLAHEVASWSKDKVKVGAVVVDENRNPRGFGYNGLPRGLDDDRPERQAQPLKSLYWEHAERNVLYACSRNGISCDGCTVYVTHWPCADCARGIIQSGIRTVVVDQACMDPTQYFYQKWADQIAESKQMFDEAGIRWSMVDAAPYT